MRNGFRAIFLSVESMNATETFAPTTKLSKIFRMFWSFFMLVVVASYTAGLAAAAWSNSAGSINSIASAAEHGARVCVYAVSARCLPHTRRHPHTHLEDCTQHHLS